MAVSQSAILSNKGDATVTFTATETYTSTAENYSDVQVQFTCYATNSADWYHGTIDLYVYIDGVLVRGGVDSDNVWKDGAGEYCNIDCGTFRVYHNADGTKTANIRVVTDWGGWGAADMSANYTLTTIAREAKWTTNNGDITIGNSKDFNWTNDANGYVKIVVKVGDTVIATLNRGQTTGYQWTPTSSQISSIYTALGSSARTATITYTMTTYSDSVYSTQIGNPQVLTGTVTAPQNYEGAVPTFSASNVSLFVSGSWAVKDPDGTTLQTNLWSTLLGNSAVLKNQSSISGSITGAATPKYSATIANYKVSVGNQSYIFYTPGAFGFTAASNKTVTVKVTDSRGDYTTVTKSLTYLNENYTAPSITSFEVVRDSDDGSLVMLTLAGTYYGTEYLSGQASVGTANALNLKYRYKTTNEENYSNWVDITSSMTLSGTDFGFSGNLPTSFNVGEVYSIQVMAYDYVKMDYETQTLPIGSTRVPLHITTEGTSVLGMFDHDKGGYFQVNGKVHDPIVGEVTMYAGSSEVNGWLECDGSAISRAEYRDLFTVIGTTYGSGNGTTTFNIPNLTSADVKYIIKY